jgi:hypothetical protein
MRIAKNVGYRWQVPAARARDLIALSFLGLQVMYTLGLR